MKNEPKKILIIGGGEEGKTVLLHQIMKEKFGDDIILVTPEEAKEQGLNERDFANISPMKITRPPEFDFPVMKNAFAGNGRSRRRDRRKHERNLKRPKHHWGGALNYETR